MEDKTIFDLIRDWAEERGIYTDGRVSKQYEKLLEETGELGRALIENDNAEIDDAIGDMVIVLTNLAHQRGTTIEKCIEGAYDEIKDRKGCMENGTFVKHFAND